MTLKEKLAQGRFVVTAEVTPPLSASAEKLLKRVEPLLGLVDAINVTDAPAARPYTSSFAAAAILARAGIEPIVQVTCRDRNRIALISDLLGAAAQGIENLLVLHGDDPSKGDMPDAKPVYDLDTRGLISLARQMSEERELPSGRRIEPAPRFFIGCADTVVEPRGGWSPTGLEAKIAAGARFAQSQFCFDLDLAGRYVDRLVHAGVLARLDFILGVGPLVSAEQARIMNENLFGVSIPAAVIDRLESATDAREEGLAICAELIAGLRRVEGVSGVHIMAPAQLPERIAEVIRAAGLKLPARMRPAGSHGTP